MSRLSGFLTEKERGYKVVSLISLQEESVHQSLEEVELESVIQTNLSHRSLQFAAERVRRTNTPRVVGEILGGRLTVVLSHKLAVFPVGGRTWVTVFGRRCC